jgi:hypothetical protein
VEGECLPKSSVKRAGGRGGGEDVLGHRHHNVPTRTIADRVSRQHLALKKKEAIARLAADVGCTAGVVHCGMWAPARTHWVKRGMAMRSTNGLRYPTPEKPIADRACVGNTSLQKEKSKLHAVSCSPIGDMRWLPRWCRQLLNVCTCTNTIGEKEMALRSTNVLGCPTPKETIADRACLGNTSR